MRAQGLVLAGALAALSSLTVAVAYDTGGARTTLAILTVLGLSTVLATDALVRRRRRIGSLRRQATFLGALVVVQVALGVGGFVVLMFVNTHDAVLAGLVALETSVLGLWAARMLLHETMDDIDTIRGTLEAVGGGARGIRTDVAGQDEIARLARDVDVMVARLETEERTRRALIAAVSHDLRTPITALRLLAEAIDDDIADPGTRRQYATRMGTHVRTLGALIDDLFELTRLQSGELALTLKHIDLDEVIAEAVSAMQPTAEERRITLGTHFEGAAPLALANPEKVQRVLFNLIQNAIRHTPPDGSVVVATARVDGAVEVAVNDTGSGIPSEQHDRVFEPFFRGDGARTEPGSGLGLAIARAIVEAHGGRIWLAPSTAGTSVRFCIPVP